WEFPAVVSCVPTAPTWFQYLPPGYAPKQTHRLTMPAGISHHQRAMPLHTDYRAAAPYRLADIRSRVDYPRLSWQIKNTNVTFSLSSYDDRGHARSFLCGRRSIK